MGTGRVAGDGNFADRSARVVFGNFTAGIHVWIPVRRGGLRDCLPGIWVARLVCRWRTAGAVGHLHSRQSSGVTGLVTTEIDSELLDERGRHPERALAVVPL